VLAESLEVEQALLQRAQRLLRERGAGSLEIRNPRPLQGVEVMGDNLACSDMVDGAKRLEDLGCDYIVHHIGYDERRGIAARGERMPNPLDQFLAHHPDYFFDRSPEQALINPDNLLILLQHLRCAAFELPFQRNDSFGSVNSTHLAEFLELLNHSGELHLSSQKYFWMADQYPAAQVSLRSASPQSVRLLAAGEDDSSTTIGEVDLASAAWMVHPQAIYLHEGQSYLVEALSSLRPGCGPRGLISTPSHAVKPRSSCWRKQPRRRCWAATNITAKSW